MATQRCPKCKGDRIRQGYQPTPLLLKMAFIQNLLCNDCNWEFKGFAVPGTVSRKTKKKRNHSTDLDDNSSQNDFEESDVEINEIEKTDFDENKAIDQNKALSPINSEINESVESVIALNGENSVKKLVKNKSKVKKKVRVKMH
jgi:hypothetical protein